MYIFVNMDFKHYFKIHYLVKLFINSNKIIWLFRVVQSTSATCSLSLFSRPTFFPVNDGQPFVVTMTLFFNDNCILENAFFTHSKISYPVVLCFMVSIDSNSSVISKFSDMPRTKMVAVQYLCAFIQCLWKHFKWRYKLF